MDLKKDRSGRALYGKVSRSKPEESLTLFDFPNPCITSERRNITQVPLQQLFFLNSDFLADVSAALVKRLFGKSTEQRIASAYQLLFLRDPSAGELRLAADFLKKATWPEYALSSNEFQFVD